MIVLVLEEVVNRAVLVVPACFTPVLVVEVRVITLVVPCYHKCGADHRACSLTVKGSRLGHTMVLV